MNAYSLPRIATTLGLCATAAFPALADGIFPDTQSVTRGFLDSAGLEGFRTTLAQDGATYWSSSGGGIDGVRLAQYSADGTLLDTYEPGLDFRSIFTDGGIGPVYARQYNSRQIYVQSSPGLFVNDLTLSGGVLDPDSTVALDPDGSKFAAMHDGTVQFWDRAGNHMGSLELIGYGTRFNEGDSPQNNIIICLDIIANIYMMTYSEGHMSAWDMQGVRVGSTELLTAGQTFDSYTSFSVTPDRVAWVLDEPGGLWKGYDLVVTDCLADFDGNGVVDTRDVLAFLNAWTAQDGSSDCDGDGAIDTRDVLCFLNVWNAGC